MNVKTIFPVLIFAMLTACSGAGSRGNEVCDCFRLLVNEVNSKNVDFASDNAAQTLQGIYDDLKAKDANFNTCTADFVKRYGTFSSSKLRMLVSVNDDCKEIHETLLKIADAGPLVYETEQ